MLRAKRISIIAIIFAVAVSMMPIANPTSGVASAATSTKNFNVKTASGSKTFSVTVDTTGADEAYAQLNSLRASKGLSALKRDSQLDAVAQQRAAEQIELFSHTRPNGTAWSTAFDTKTYNVIGENLAKGPRTASVVMNAWANSTAHMDNMISRTNYSKQYTNVGIAHVIYNGKHYWVQSFGKPDDKVAQVTGTTAKNSGSKKVKTSWKKVSNADGYQISQSPSKKGTKVVATQSKSGNTKVVKAKKNKKMYYKVRAYKTVNGKKVYGAWSTTKVCKAK